MVNPCIRVRGVVKSSVTSLFCSFSLEIQIVRKYVTRMRDPRKGKRSPVSHNYQLSENNAKPWLVICRP